jgi:26S proteasome regulatory subunit N5
MADDLDSKWKGANFKDAEDHSVATKALLDRINSDTVPVLLRSTNTPLQEFLNELLELEKTARLGSDTLSTQRLAVEIVRILRTQQKTSEMLTTMDFLMKRRAQTKQVQSAMIAEAGLSLLDEGLTDGQREETLTQLTHITDGKIHVELEHARFTVQLAKICEGAGRKKEALDQLSSLHVETITNMPRNEKIDIINDQIRLTLEIGSILHTPMVSRKVSHRALSKPESKSKKVTYFLLMADYYSRVGAFLSMGRCFYEIALSAGDDQKDQLDNLSKAAVLALLSEPQTAKELDDFEECCAFSPASRMGSREQFLKKLSEDSLLELEAPFLHQIIVDFTGVDLIRQKIAPAIDELCDSHSILRGFPDRQEQLRRRCSEHDLLVISKYYSRIGIARLASLVGLTSEVTESFVMKLVTMKTIYAKIDRIDQVVVFEVKKDALQSCQGWNENVERTVDLIDKVAHLVVKERMLHAVLPGRTGTA